MESNTTRTPGPITRLGDGVLRVEGQLDGDPSFVEGRRARRRVGEPGGAGGCRLKDDSCFMWLRVPCAPKEGGLPTRAGRLVSRAVRRQPDNSVWLMHISVFDPTMARRCYEQLIAGDRIAVIGEQVGRRIATSSGPVRLGLEVHAQEVSAERGGAFAVIR